MKGSQQNLSVIATDKSTSADEARHDAFISYSRGILARAIQAGLEKIQRRWWQLRAFDIFRDVSNLSPTSDLPAALKTELLRSRYLLLLLSPEAARSKWVKQEIDWWIEHKGDKGIESIILILTAGNLVWDDNAKRFDPVASTAFPPVLIGKHRAEPRWEDLRWATEESKLTTGHVEFRNALIGIAATLKGVSRDTLESDALKAQKITRRWVASAALALTIALGIALAQTWLTQNARILSEARLLQPSNPSESLLVLRDLSTRWGAEPIVLPYLPQQLLMSTPVTIWREYLPKGVGHATFLSDGGFAAAGTDGKAYVWSSNNHLRATLPARYDMLGSTRSAIPLSKLIPIETSHMGTLDWNGCIRIFDLNMNADAMEGKIAQTCMNVQGSSYGASGWDSFGNIAYVSNNQVYLLPVGGIAINSQIPNAESIDAIAPIASRSAVLFRTKSGRVGMLAMESGEHQYVTKADQIGNCDDGSAWALDKSGKFWLSAEPTRSVVLYGKGSWQVSSDCRSYINSMGDYYAMGQTKPKRARVAWGWNSAGSGATTAPGGNLIVTSNFEGQIVAHDMQLGTHHILAGHTSRIFSLSYNKDATRLISASYDDSIRIFDLRGGLVLSEKTIGKAQSIYAGKDGPLISPDPYVAEDLSDDAFDQPQRVKVYSAMTPTLTYQTSVRSDWRIADRYLLLDTESRKILICTQPRCPPDSVERSIDAETETSGGGAHARVSPDGRYVVAAEEGQLMRVYDLNRTDNSPVFRYADENIQDASFDSSGDNIFILSKGKVVTLPFSLQSVAGLVDQRIAYCLTPHERQTYMGEWSWFAPKRTAICRNKAIQQN